mmetsp:Transcript_6999/g.11685  ORF Transcript_6999/g.11685 Transcript_6999/m.11685 type:complete len:237 (-) Transcript_6999:1364-2074(-)
MSAMDGVLPPGPTLWPRAIPPGARWLNWLRWCWMAASFPPPPSGPIPPPPPPSSRAPPSMRFGLLLLLLLLRSLLEVDGPPNTGEPGPGAAIPGCCCNSSGVSWRLLIGGWAWGGSLRSVCALGARAASASSSRSLATSCACLPALSASRNSITMESRPRSMARLSGVQRFSIHSPSHVSGSAISSMGMTSTAIDSVESGNICSSCSITSMTGFMELMMQWTGSRPSLLLWNAASG